MSFNPLAKEIVLKLCEREDIKSVMELGNQRYLADRDFQTVQDFYKSIGVKTHACIDVNKLGEAMIMDLNLDLRNHYDFHEQYDLVTNNGTGEHLFNQHAVFKNTHDLCKTEGYMLHILPFQNWINHGFFGFHPVLFRDLSIINRYRIDRIFLADRSGRKSELEIPECWEDARANDAGAFKTGTHIVNALHEVISHGTVDVFVVCLFQKTTDKPFRAPFQGHYASDIEAREIRARYQLDKTIPEFNET